MKLFDINSDLIDFMCLYLQKFFRIIQYADQERCENLYNYSLLKEIEEDILHHSNAFVNLNQKFIQTHSQKRRINMCKAVEKLKQECITKSKTEIALNMLSEGFHHNLIADITRLSLDDVLKLSTH